MFPLTIPELKARTDDIPIITRHFIDQHNAKNVKRIAGISPAAVARLASYAWPGNVRELRNAIDYALVVCPGGEISPQHLPQRIAAATDCPAPLHPSTAIERTELIQALRQAGGNQSDAARLLGVSRVTIWKQIKKHRIDLSRELL